MLLVSVLVLLVSLSLSVTVWCSPVLTDTHAEGKYNALRFGQSTSDFIQWSPNMVAFARQFSVCTWIRKRYQSSNPMVLHYYPHSHGMILGDDGSYNYVVGSQNSGLNLESKFSVPNGEWFHVCWMWSTSTYTTTVYLNGERIGSGTTNQRELRTGGEMCLGNHQGNTKYTTTRYTFGGDMFKLNIFNRVLIESEIRSMASDICSHEEEKLTAIRILKWEDIILKDRSGSVSEITTGCYEETLLSNNTQRLRLIEERQESFENDILKRLQNTELELAETKSNLERSEEKLENITMSLTSIQIMLNSTEQELEDPKTNLTLSLKSTLVELNNTKQELAETKADLTQRLENVNMTLTSTLVKLNSTEVELAVTKKNLKCSEEKLENVTKSLNHTLEQLELETARKDKVHSKWDVLFSDKFFNKKLTREMSQELKSTWDMLDLFLGVNITEAVIENLKRYYEGDMVCLNSNTGN